MLQLKELRRGGNKKWGINRDSRKLLLPVYDDRSIWQKAASFRNWFQKVK